MDNRGLILADLRRFYDEKGPGNYVLADTLSSFKSGDEHYILAINQLLAEGLVLGIHGADKRVGLALNPEKMASIQPSIQNFVTVNLGPGATFTGPFAVGQTISQTYAATESATTDQLRDLLQQLVIDVGKLIESTDSPKEKNELAEQLATFVQQANKETPSQTLLTVTGKGLLDAAKAVASLAGPITTAVKAILALLV